MRRPRFSFLMNPTVVWMPFERFFSRVLAKVLELSDGGGRVDVLWMREMIDAPAGFLVVVNPNGLAHLRTRRGAPWTQEAVGLSRTSTFVSAAAADASGRVPGQRLTGSPSVVDDAFSFGAAPTMPAAAPSST